MCESEFAGELRVEQVRLQAFRTAARLLRDHQLAEDIAQETVLRLMDARRKGTSIDHDIGFAVRTAGRLAIDRIRKESRSGRERGVNELEALRGPVLVPEEIERLYSAVDQLPEMQRAAVVLRVLSEMDYGVIAELLGVTEATCRSHCRFGLKRLRTLLDGQ